MFHVRAAARHRLAAAVTTVLAVTAGAALTTAAHANAVPAGPAGVVRAASAAPADARDGVITIPATSRIVGAGQSGFLAAEATDSGSVFRWTSTTTGTTTELPKRYSGYHAGGTDTVATKEDGKTQYLLHDMSSPGSAPKVISQPDTRLSWRGLVDRTLVFSSWDPNGKKGQLRLVREGIHEGSDRQVTGLPANFTFQSMEPVSATTMFVRYYVDDPDARRFHFAVVDVTSASVVEQREVGAAGYSVDSAVSTGRMAWVEGASTAKNELKYADRDGTGSAPAVKLLDLGNALNTHVSILGDWLAYTAVPYAQSYDLKSDRFAFNALNVLDNRTVKLLDHATSAVPTPDGALLVRGGTLAQGEGIYRVALGEDGTPTATLVADTGVPTALTVLKTDVPPVVDLDRNGGSASLSWTLARYNAKGTVTLRHVRTGQSVERTFSGTSATHGPRVVEFPWNGLLTGAQGYAAFAPGGDYTWEFNATPVNGIGPDVKESGTFKVTRAVTLHDYTDNSTPDLLSRDSSGVLWRDDSAKTPSSSAPYSTGRVRVGSGWQIFNQLEAVGDVAGSPAGDVVARDASGVLWLYQGKGDGNFAGRTKVGGGWNTYNKITGGSDLDGDGRSDLLATDTTGALWFYKGTGDAASPFGARVKVGSGWGIFNQLTATGNLSGTAAGDLVARDTAGVLWLYEGKGDGAFAPRTKIGGGWGGFTHLVGIGDADRDGRNDLYAVGASGSKLYAGTGNTTTPFAPAVAGNLLGDSAPVNSVF
ncbi:VCBS repeat-containing protein [Streptomyces sp. Je 1-79]|uniref:FG-GAP repeat domain-containing protein n=1 Tax=Streptomyces sp. Je 1-79 TaxID=2943847 RepID=UPI0021A9247B|nr:VCBS repeat-containing protein [Streptomyces sp. Je 1-79]MCT4357689.1 VCBS repeat-containing protein [Streptomyces sp. Je 1-79]